MGGRYQVYILRKEILCLYFRWKIVSLHLRWKIQGIHFSWKIQGLHRYILGEAHILGGKYKVYKLGGNRPTDEPTFLTKRICSEKKLRHLFRTISRSMVFSAVVLWWGRCPTLVKEKSVANESFLL